MGYPLLHVVESFRNGRWLIVGRLASAGEAKTCADALNDLGFFEHRWRTIG